jgi:cellulose synthase/poly-beta-1,6-N-acetylglucosamine synthase-like glycosyltransferase
MKGVLIASFALLGYVYLGYPLLCAILSSVRRRRVHAQPCTPRVSILISAYNEVGCIVGTVRNKLDLDYPADQCEIIVISDGSTDGTDEAVAGLAACEKRVRLFHQEPRAGKTSALNLAATQAHGEILVFSDANSVYASDALRKLVEPFADPDVGYVTGRMLYLSADGSPTGEGCSAYMHFENTLRGWERSIGSVVGVDGGIDAVRSTLFVPMRADQQPDFILPLSVVERRRRVVFAPGARVYEASLTRPGDEFRMRTRVALRAWHALHDKVGLLNPLRYGLFSWQLFSHKWLRYLAPVFQLAALVSNIALVGQGSWWNGILAMQAVFYVLASLGFLGYRMPGPLSFPYYLCLLNAAAGVALVRFLRGQKQVTWKPRT